jgi:integrase
MQFLAMLDVKSVNNMTTTHSKTDTRYWLSRVFKHERVVNAKRYSDTDYSVLVAHKKQRKQFALSTPNKFEAANKAREIYRSLVLRGWDTTLKEFKEKKQDAAAPARADDATIAEFLSELKALHASRAKTIDDYATSLRRIAASIAGIASGGRGGSADTHKLWREKVDACKLSILTPQAVQKWRESFIVAAASDPVKQRSARVSANTFLREARSLFSPRYLEGLTLQLPTPLPFTGIKLERRAMPRYQSHFDVSELMRAASDELAADRPEEFKAFVLAVCAGLRRNEIDKLEWNKFNFSTSAINVTATEFFRTKSEDSARSVWIPSEMLEIFRGYRARATGRFVLESSVKANTSKSYEHYRCAATFDGLIDWLRTRGIEGEKPLHTLRKEFGSLIAQRYGIYAAKEMLGHSNITTTAAHYIEAKEKPVITLGHLLKQQPTNAVDFAQQKKAI